MKKLAILLSLFCTLSALGQTTISRHESLIDSPSKLSQPAPSAFIGGVELFTKFHQAIGDPFVCEHAITSPVSALPAHGFPFAISRLVTLRVVNPINGEPWGPFSHVGQKVSERSPPFTNFNPPAPVIGVEGFFGVDTSSNDASPRFVGGGLIFYSGVAMNEMVAIGRFEGVDFVRHNGLVVVFSDGRSDTTGARCDLSYLL